MSPQMNLSLHYLSFGYLLWTSGNLCLCVCWTQSQMLTPFHCLFSSLSLPSSTVSCLSAWHIHKMTAVCQLVVPVTCLACWFVAWWSRCIASFDNSCSPLLPVLSDSNLLTCRNCLWPWERLHRHQSWHWMGRLSVSMGARRGDQDLPSNFEQSYRLCPM